MCDNETLRLVYQIKANHIESLKTGLWRTAYYTTLAQSGIVGLSELFERTQGLPNIAPSLLPISLLLCIASLIYAIDNIKNLTAERKDQKQILGTLSPSIQRKFAKGQKDDSYGSMRHELPYTFTYMGPVLVATVFVFWYLVARTRLPVLGPLLGILFASIAILVICLIVRWWARDC